MASEQSRELPEPDIVIVVFDPEKFRDTATFDKPHQYAAGVKWVLVNGHAAVKDGQYQDAVLGGRVLRWKQP